MRSQTCNGEGSGDGLLVKTLWDAPEKAWYNPTFKLLPLNLTGVSVRRRTHRENLSGRVAVETIT